MKYRPKIWSITWRYLIVALILAAAVYGFAYGLFIGSDSETGAPYFLPWGFAQYFLVSLVPTVLIGFYILSVTLYYYTIDEYSFSMFRFGKEFVFEYKNIEFIDIEESKRKHQVIFYSPKSRTRYMLGDKDGVLLETLIKKCPKTLTVEEFKKKHPEERY